MVQDNNQTPKNRRPSINKLLLLVENQYWNQNKLLANVHDVWNFNMKPKDTKNYWGEASYNQKLTFLLKTFKNFF
jgi:hypothetical protein